MVTGQTAATREFHPARENFSAGDETFVVLPWLLERGTAEQKSVFRAGKQESLPRKESPVDQSVLRDQHPFGMSEDDQLKLDLIERRQACLDFLHPAFHHPENPMAIHFRLTETGIKYYRVFYIAEACSGDSAF